MFDKYPYTDFHELNLDWFLTKFQTLDEAWTDFKNTYVDKIDELTMEELQAMYDDGRLAKLIIEHVGYATPEMFGAAGDGATDDTESIQKALDAGNVLLLEKSYLITDTLYVNVNTSYLKGLSSRSVILTNAADKPAIIFYSPDGTYEDRNKRENIHGSFTVRGTNSRACDGIQIAGTAGTDYEGMVECNQFQNIRIDNVGKALIFSAHCYKDLFTNVDVNDCTYSIYSISSSDTGEATEFNNCSFWAGSIYCMQRSPKFIACTIHYSAQNTINGFDCAHYFDCNDVYFDGCHFEYILNSDISRADEFIFYNTSSYFNGCDALVTLQGHSLTIDTLIKCTGTTGNGQSAKCIIKGGNWKYCFGRITVNNALTSGPCIIDVPWKRVTDAIGLPKVYESSEIFQSNLDNSFEDLYVTSGDSYNIVSSEDEVTITLTTGAYHSTNPFWFRNIIPAAGKNAIRMHGTITTNTGEIYLRSGILTDHCLCIMFLDQNGQMITIDQTAENIIPSITHSASLTLDLTLAIPYNTAKIAFGIAGNTGAIGAAQTCTITSDMMYEFI